MVVDAYDDDDNDDDDDDLRAALALSLQSNETQDHANATTAATATATTPLVDDNYHCYDFDCRSFHSLMWDDAGTTTTTTDNDKERWIHECIATPFLRQRRQRSELLKRQLLKQRHRGGEGKGGGPTISSSDTATTAAAAAAAAAADASSGVIGDRHVENKDAVDGLGDEDDDYDGIFVEEDDDVLRHNDAAHRCDGDFQDALRQGNDDVIADAIPHDVVAPRRPTPLEVFTGSSSSGTSWRICPPSREKRRKRQPSTSASFPAVDAVEMIDDAADPADHTAPSSSTSSSSPRPLQLWGLVQKHGGPCGVLAAVQAEMIRVLLFGRKRKATESRTSSRRTPSRRKNGRGSAGRGAGDDDRVDGPDGDEGGDDGYLLYYPHELTASSATDSDDEPPPSPITEREAREAMAMAIGMILARAALASSSSPPSSAASPDDGIDSDDRIQTMPPQPRRSDDTPVVVKLVLPTRTATTATGSADDEDDYRHNDIRISDDFLSPSTSSTTASWIQEMLGTPSIAPTVTAGPITPDTTTIACVDTTSNVSGLTVHVVSEVKCIHRYNYFDDGFDYYNGSPSSPVTIAKDDTNIAGDVETMPEMKRPRNNSDGGNSTGGGGEGGGDRADKTMTTTKIGTSTTLLTPEQLKLNSLAMSVADFLLSNHRGRRGEGGVDSDKFRGIVETSTSMDADSASPTNTDGSAATAAGSSLSTRSPPPLEYFQCPGGVMYLVMSLATTRGIGRIRADMDDPNTTMTSQFGHSSQELMNLLLTGRAVSNVFDNSMTISDSLTCHGIRSRSDIGYLTILESLRYCEVGGNYKSPSFPIWIVASTGHFSVLFGDENCLKESKSDLLLEKCRRAFQKVEGGGGENGFIPVEKLGDVLQELDLMSNVGCDEWLQTLQAYLEIAGAGIILWDDFWRICSRLMTGSSLESILSSQDDSMQVDVNEGVLFTPNEVASALASFSDDGGGAGVGKNNNRNGPPLLITQFGEGKILPMMSAPAHQSDEELAKKLATEWGSLPIQGGTFEETPSSTVDQAMKSDEDYARELQAMWDAEMTAAGHSSTGGSDNIDLTSQVATTDDVGTLESDDDDHMPFPTVPNMENSEKGTSTATGTTVASVGTTATTATTATSSNDATVDNNQDKNRRNQLEFEKHGHSFSLFHYNGLHGGILTHFQLTRLSPTEAVGASIALSISSGHGTGGCDLEDVVRTKWPSSVMNWFGKNPPSID